jgi:basic membrane lipoprotein Med (substrate-binding protein (PBP1-ABC) superfamily)/DNA-binding SARP family transcriptional activator
MMYFRILGPMEAGAGAAAVPLGSPKQRALLAILVIHLGEIVPIDRLIDLLWGDRPPRTAAHSVQIYVSDLRKAMEPFGGASLIVTRQPGYQLQASPESVDAYTFEQLVEDGTSRIRDGNPDTGAAALRSAMRLWRGPALSDFAYEDFAQPYIRRLTDLHLDAIEELAAVDLDAGRTTEVLPSLGAAIHEDPLRERARELLMLALYRSGRNAEALRTFQRMRELLADELGLDPSPPLLRLQERILLHDPTLMPRATTAADSLRGRNPYKGLRPFAEDDVADFFGRDALVERLIRSIRDGARLITLVGPSGSGKTSVVSAGVIAQLRTGSDSERWAIATMIPGSDPLTEAETIISRAWGDAAGSGPGLGIGGPEAGRPTAGGTDDRRLLLIIDQFEELFTATDENSRRRFLDALASAVSDPDGRLSALLALRADFYDRPLLDAAFADVFIPSVLNVVPMTAHELEAAVLKPAERVGVKVETGLLAELVAETADRPGGLPMLQYALTDLFDQQTDRVLTLAGYRSMGGVRGILSNRADVLYAELGAEEQRVTMQVFLRLVRLGQGTVDSRRRIALSDLTDLGLDPVALSTVLQAFGGHRFLSFDRDQVTGEATVEVAHEALFREWDRLAAWIDRHRSALRRHATFRAAVEEWESSGRDPDYLLSGSRLAEFEAWRHEAVLQLTGRERDFLEAGLEHERSVRDAEAERASRQRRLERRARGGFVALILAIAVLGGAVVLALLGLQRQPFDKVAVLHWAPGDFDYLLRNGFDQGVAEFELVGTDRIATTEDGQADLRSLSKDGNRLIVTFSIPSPVFDEVVREFPDTRYVMMDRIGTEPNVTYMVFDDHESSFLAGAAAALKSKSGTIGFVGGVDIDVIWRFQAGYEAGARAIDPTITILSAYLSQPPDFSGFQSQVAGRNAAASMYRKGADVVFTAAGLGGYGAFQAATELSEASGAELWAIGADSDQFENVALLPGVVDAGRWQQHILTSVVKRWDRAVYGVLADHAHGTLFPGVSGLDLGSGGVDISYSGGFLEDIKPRLEELRAQIVSGRLAVPCVPVEKNDEAVAQGVEPSCRR